MWHNDKSWDDQDCGGNFPFVCTVMAKPLPPPDYTCDEVGGLHEPGSNKCFFVPPQKTATWAQAEQQCQTQGGHLASITSQSENDLVYQLYVSSGARESHN
eukprot:1158502-Rhodomonas_salina.1